jgi:NADH dehydrogenase
MKVLVTGGTGVVGRAAVDHLVAGGHQVRLLSRHATSDAERWSSGVEGFDGDVSDPAKIFGAADGCDAVLHVAGIVSEDPPEVTFERVNVEGTRNLVREAQRAGVDRFVYVSSLGADRGASDYHRSKRAAEDVVRHEFDGRWMVVRPGNVYGPGDEVISLLLKMVRTLPAIPVVGGGDQPFQPVWADDLGKALANAVEKDGAYKQIHEIAGTETTNVRDLLDQMEKITDRHPVRVPVPEFLARAGAQVAEKLGISIPVNEDQLVMLEEENVIAPGGVNALTDTFGVTPIPLFEGLVKLSDAIPEKMPSEGTGTMRRERFWADIHGSKLSPEEVLLLVREQFHTLPNERLMEVGPEPAPPTRMEPGATLTLSVPARGHVQVRVQEVTPRSVTSVTLEGHFFAGVVRFLTDQPGPGVVRFEVRAYVRGADLPHWLAMRTIGKTLQAATWASVVEEVARRAGGEIPDGVQHRDEGLDEEDAKQVEQWTEGLVKQRQRDEAPDAGVPPAGSAHPAGPHPSRSGSPPSP